MRCEYMRNKSICFILAFALILCILPSVSASSSIQPRYTAILYFNHNLSIDSSGLATCSGKVEAKANLPTKLIIKLQRYSNGTWTTIKSWEDTGDFYVRLSKTYYVADGYSYRVYVEGYVYDVNGSLLEKTSGTTLFNY